MATIHLIDAEKGGVGKSVVARTLYQLFLDRNIEVVPMEADRSNPTFSNIYGKRVKKAIFSEDRQFDDSPDIIFDTALETPVILDFPAQVHRSFSKWLTSKGLLELGASHDVKFVKWFVCDGGNDSVNLFLKSVQHYKGELPHILVKNLGRTDNWSILKANTAVQDAIKEYRIPTIEFPRLSEFRMNTIDTRKLTFEAAREDSELGLIGRSQIVIFLRSAYEAFDESGWTPAAIEKPSGKEVKVV